MKLSATMKKVVADVEADVSQEVAQHVRDHVSHSEAIRHPNAAC
jgi:hypothetical protein